MSIAQHTFLDVLASLAGAVTALTMRDAQGQLWGFTATSFCSLSIDPPLVLVCLARSADCYTAFTGAESFAVNILATHQRDLAQRFASKGVDKFHETRYIAGPYGMPVLQDALAFLECRLSTIYPGGDHVILVGQVEYGGYASSEQENMPLLYYRRTYGTFSRLDQSAGAGKNGKWV